MSMITIILKSNLAGFQKEGPIPSEFEELHFGGTPSAIFESDDDLEQAKLEQFLQAHAQHYVVGYMNYDLGYQMMTGKSCTHQKVTHLPSVWLAAYEPEAQSNHSISNSEIKKSERIFLKQMVSKDRYVKVTSQLKQHIQLGDIYEVNYCIPFVAENIEIDPYHIWQRLNEISPMPFAAFIDHPNFSIISASPERFIKKVGNQLFIQPMKGTKPKGKTAEEDLAFYDELQNDPKERAENVMIVDLTRNDLSKLATKGSVQVEELFGVYAFQSVHQMISTVSCRMKPGLTYTDIMHATYPMGSMTGAPKKRAVELIEEYEDFSRGPFSGMLGYFDPYGSFDFNVMIRTIYYDKLQNKIFMAVGSAITAKSDVDKEYEECLIKLQPLLKALNATLM